jgi:hypothetical protein
MAEVATETPSDAAASDAPPEAPPASPSEDAPDVSTPPPTSPTPPPSPASLDTAPPASAPDPAPDATTSEDARPSAETAPGTTASDETAAGAATPDDVASDDMASDDAAPDETTDDELTMEDAAFYAAVADEIAAADAAASDAAASDSSPADASPADASPADEAEAPPAAAPPPAAPAPHPAPDRLAPEVPAEPAAERATPAREGTTAGSPVVAPFLQAARAALGAHTVCLLVQADMDWTYRIAAIASRATDVATAGTFETQRPLLTAGMSQQPVSIVRLSEASRNDLRYYDAAPPPIHHLALAPVPRPAEPETYFLLADALDGHDLNTNRVRTLLARFAELLSVLLAHEPAAHDPFGFDELFDATEADPRTPALDEDDEPPRPRSEIVAEEMERAYVQGQPMALVLVHLNEAEALAREGEATVREAEIAFDARLRDAAPAGSRVERFGELTYGVFLHGAVADVEAWTQSLQADLDRATGLLYGGASIGASMFASRHDTPDALRRDATVALREAYDSGATVIVE